MPQSLQIVVNTNSFLCALHFPKVITNACRRSPKRTLHTIQYRTLFSYNIVVSRACAATHKKSARWRLLFNKEKFNRNTHTYQAKIAISKYTGSLAFSSSKPTHIIYKYHFNYEYVAVEYGQPRFVNFQCVLRT